jgi:metal-dependent amidase/aminoacylase/carboxypeptidase family protein
MGTVGIREGAVMAAVDQFTITLTGLGGHAGYPHKTIDPIPVLAELTLALQTVVSRRNSPFADALISCPHR